MADPSARRSIPVLTYHSIDASGSPVSTAAGEFRRQLNALSTAGWRTIGVDAFLRGHRDGGWPARCFVLTFDDGYRNLLEEALPIASALGYTGIVFVASDRVGGRMAGPGEPSWTPGGPLLDWDGLRAVAAQGWTIGSHTRSHRALPSLPDDEVARELASSRSAIERELGAQVTTLAYPYGACSPGVERIAGEHYEACFGTKLAYATAASRTTNVERIDAYYLRGRGVDELDGLAMRGYLRLRRAGRTIRARLARG